MLYSILKVIASILLRLVFRIRIHGERRLPTGSLILCSNHISMLDPVVLAIVFDRKINFMAKKELFDNPIARYLLQKLGVFPVDRGKSDIKSIKTSLKILKDKKVLGIFPEGTRVKNISFDNIKPGVGLLAARTDTDIVPVRIVSEYKIFSAIDIYIRDIIVLDSYDRTDPDINHTLTLEAYKAIYREEAK